MFPRSVKIIYSTVGGLLVIAGVLFFLNQNHKIGSKETPVKPPGQFPSGLEAAVSASVLLSKTYVNSQYGFSFKYPEGFNVSGFPEGEEGTTILAQKPNSKEGFQIFISNFDEPGPITPARIKKDIPDMAVEDPKEVFIGSEKNLRALIFFSRSESLGRTREVWFVQKGNLYRVSAYEGLDNLIGPVLETIKFK